MGHVCCHNGLADFSKTQADHPNAQPRCWLRAARRTRMKKPRRGAGLSQSIHDIWAFADRGADPAASLPIQRRAARLVAQRPAGAT